MIPQNALSDAINIITQTEQPSTTYHWDIPANRIYSYADEQLAMKQAIYHILMTERYKWVIYSWNYGVELEDLFGMPTTYCVPEIKRRVTEALLWDDRVQSVDNWEFDLSVRETVRCKFTAHTVFGNVDIDWIEVPV